MDANQLYYRVLWTDKTYNNWINHYYHSSHNSITGNWIETWKQTKSMKESDYQLTTFDGVYTIEALRFFLDYANQNGLDNWSDNVLTKASEMAGVCAFYDPLSVFRYANLTVDKSRASKFLFVVFKGIELGNGVCIFPHQNETLVDVQQLITPPLFCLEFINWLVENNIRIY